MGEAGTSREPAFEPVQELSCLALPWAVQERVFVAVTTSAAPNASRFQEDPSPRCEPDGREIVLVKRHVKFSKEKIKGRFFRRHPWAFCPVWPFVPEQVCCLAGIVKNRTFSQICLRN